MPSYEDFQKIFGTVKMIRDPMSLPAAKRSFPGDPNRSNANRLDYIYIAAAARRSKILSPISFPVATLALNSGAPQGGMMPNQYTGGGIATVFHTPKKYFHNLVGRKT